MSIGINLEMDEDYDNVHSLNHWLEDLKSGLPRFIRRKSDGALLKRNDDDTYSLVGSMMARPHRYSYELLLVGYKNYFEPMYVTQSKSVQQEAKKKSQKILGLSKKKRRKSKP